MAGLFSQKAGPASYAGLALHFDAKRPISLACGGCQAGPSTRISTFPSPFKLAGCDEVEWLAISSSSNANRPVDRYARRQFGNSMPPEE